MSVEPAAASGSTRPLTVFSRTRDPWARLRRGWTLVAAEVGAFPELPALLAAQLDALERAPACTEGELLDAVEQVCVLLRERGLSAAEPTLERRLRRVVYEYLLALDAASEGPACGLAAGVTPVTSDPTWEPHVIALPVPADAEPEASAATATVAPAWYNAPLEPERAEAPATPARPPLPQAPPLPSVEVLPPPPPEAPRLPRSPLEQACSAIASALHRRRLDEVVAAVEELALAAPGGDAVALALETGDTCRALPGGAVGASECYLVALRGSPNDEAALWRLAEMCLERRDHALALSYLERLVAIRRRCGDVRGVVAIYRKMTIVAPDRDDIRELMARIQATGRLDW